MSKRPPADINDLPLDWTTWDQVAADHAGFRQALETLMQKGCTKGGLFELLGVLYGTGEEEGWSRTSVEEARSGLQRGIDALTSLMARSERALLRVDAADLRRAREILTQAAGELRPIERKADARRSIRRDVGKALLVRYVKMVTGRWHDKEVAEILDVALDSPSPVNDEPVFDQAGDVVDAKTVEIDYGSLPAYTMEAHRRWRGRNTAPLELPDLEERWTKDQQQFMLDLADIL